MKEVALQLVRCTEAAQMLWKSAFYFISFNSLTDTHTKKKNIYIYIRENYNKNPEL